MSMFNSISNGLFMFAESMRCQPFVHFFCFGSAIGVVATKELCNGRKKNALGLGSIAVSLVALSVFTTFYKYNGDSNWFFPFSRITRSDILSCSSFYESLGVSLACKSELS